MWYTFRQKVQSDEKLRKDVKKAAVKDEALQKKALKKRTDKIYAPKKLSNVSVKWVNPKLASLFFSPLQIKDFFFLKKMPRYVTPSTSAMRQQHTKSYTIALNSLSEAATQIEDICQLGQTVNVRSVRLNSVVYPYAAPQIRYNDQKCFEFGADGMATVPFTPQHVFTNGADLPFSIVAWVKLGAMPTACPIFNHGTEYSLGIDVAQSVVLTVGTDAENYIQRSSIETCNTEEWVCVAATYAPSTQTAADITLYIDGVPCTYTDTDAGVHTGMVNGTGSSNMGFDGLDYAMAAFGDLVLYNKALSSYEAVSLYNSGSVKNIGLAPIAISRYTFGDHASDAADNIADVISGLDAACAGTVTLTEDAAGGGAANVGLNAMDGTLIVTLQNIPEIRSYVNLQATVLGTQVSATGTWSCPFVGTQSAGTYENYWADEQGASIAIENPAIVSSLQVRLGFLASEMVGDNVTKLPCVQWPGHVTCRLTISYEEV